MNEQIEQLYQIINQVNKLEKALIFLYLDDLKYNEIATIIGITETNVATKISRIKQRIKKIELLSASFILFTTLALIIKGVGGINLFDPLTLFLLFLFLSYYCYSYIVMDIQIMLREKNKESIRIPQQYQRVRKRVIRFSQTNCLPLTNYFPPVA